MKGLLALPVVIILLLSTSVFAENPFDKYFDELLSPFEKGLNAAERGDYATALKEWKPLAEQGHIDAQHNLGLMYDSGRGVTQNFKTAIKWYTKAAERGYPWSQYNLGVIYANGQGVTQDYYAAVKWYTKAAEQGFPAAQNNLGLMYFHGQGVIQDYIRAHMWWNIAASQGEKNALENRSVGEASMTPAQISEAQKLARNYLSNKNTGSNDSRETSKKGSEVDDNEIIPVASGSGFAVSSIGHVVTNNHVINGCAEVKIHHNGKAVKSRILYRDPVNDLAVLQGNFAPSRVFRLSRRNPELMQEIFVAGYPFGNQVSSSVKVTKGIVSSLIGLGNNVSNIQIDAALQPGNSGGPIFDDRGNVIAVAVAKLDLKKAVKDWGVVPENTNFGIKSNVVVNLLESNGIKIQESTNASISKTALGKLMSGATYHLSCWMTMAKAKEMAVSKVMFQDLTQ